MKPYNPLSIFSTWRADWKTTVAGLRSGQRSRWQFVGYWTLALGFGLLTLILLPLLYATNRRQCPRCSKPNMDGRRCGRGDMGCERW